MPGDLQSFMSRLGKKIEISKEAEKAIKKNPSISKGT